MHLNAFPAHGIMINVTTCTVKSITHVCDRMELQVLKCVFLERTTQRECINFVAAWRNLICIMVRFRYKGGLYKTWDIFDERTDSLKHIWSYRYFDKAARVNIFIYLPLKLTFSPYPTSKTFRSRFSLQVTRSSFNRAPSQWFFRTYIRTALISSRTSNSKLFCFYEFYILSFTHICSSLKINYYK